MRPVGLVAANAVVRRLDATLGIEGRPQSGTGQTSLLTGRNAAEEMGRHFGPWVPTPVRETLRQHSLFRVGKDRGLTIAFANAYPAGHFRPQGHGTRRPGAFPFAAHAADLLNRDESSIHRGEGVASSITTEAWRRYVDPEAPIVAADEAGRTLARIAAGHDLTIFAHYDTDHAGHTGEIEKAREVVARLDAFLGGLLETMADGTLVLVTSDHGNVEDMSTGHTLNDVPLIAFGPGAEPLTVGARSLLDVAPLILGVLERSGRSADLEGS